MNRLETTSTLCLIPCVITFGWVIGAWSATREPEQLPAPVPSIGTTTVEISELLPIRSVELDLGLAEPSTEVCGQLALINTTPHNLTISKVIDKCGCTTINIQRHTIASGETGEIELGLTTSSIPGRARSKVVVVVFEEPITPVEVEITCRTRHQDSDESRALQPQADKIGG